MRSIHLTCPGHPEATLEGYLLDCQIPLGHYEKRPAVIVCPGGGYVYCSPREGEPVALRYASQGFHAFVLRYSIGWDAAGFAPLKEVSWAVGLLREKAEEWHIDPEKIAVCGFSAGGHLALCSGILGEKKPNAMILGYPAAQLPNLPGMNFMLKLLTGREEVTDQDAYDLSPTNHITKEAPPVFIAATAEDALTPYGALAIAGKYSALGLHYELHVFQHGPHGYSLGDPTSAAGCPEMLNDSFAQWHQLSVEWLHRIFGPLKHEAPSPSRMHQILKEMGFLPPDLSSK